MISMYHDGYEILAYCKFVIVNQSRMSFSITLFLYLFEAMESIFKLMEI